MSAYFLALVSTGGGAGGVAPGTGTAEGGVCAERADWIEGLHELSRYSARACRQSALDRFHYLRMARGYVREYERELSR